MFKENREFWVYIIGIIFCFIFLYFILKGYQFPLVGFLTTGDDEERFVYEEPPDFQIDESQDYRARIYTNHGTIVIDLYEKNAPMAVNNFIFLAREGFYNGVEFHRVVNDFLIQTGSRATLDDDQENDSTGDAGYHFEDEINWNSLNLDEDKMKELEAVGYSNDKQYSSRRLERYAVAMANAGPDTNSSQFFIFTANNTDPRLETLQGRHTIFGSVIDGYDALAKINNAQVDESDAFVSEPIGEYFIRSIEIYIPQPEDVN